MVKYKAILVKEIEEILQIMLIEMCIGHNFQVCLQLIGNEW